MSDSESPASEERLRAAIGPRADYYLRHWREMDASGRKTSWNWAACLASLYWFIFRKMWLALLLFILANIVLGLAGAALPASYSIFAMIGLTFITGGYGNHLYRRQIEKLVAGPDGVERLRARGGTSPLALGIALALTAALVALAAVPVYQQIQAQRAARLHSP